MVYDLRDGRLIRETTPPPVFASGVWGARGIDRLGRAYFGPVAGGRFSGCTTSPGDRWAEIQDVPGSPGGSISYLTPDGFAVPAGDGRSVEGQVTAEGRFVPGRETPLAWASWSPDRSRLVTSSVLPAWVSGTSDPTSSTVEVWVQPADDFDAKAVLRVPIDSTDLAWRVAGAHWESESSVLLTFMQRSDDVTFLDTETDFRCSIDSETCTRLDGILLPLPVWGMSGG